MKISIIIPTHNRSEQLKQVIRSILSQLNEAECEIIVVDNNSTDNTKEVALSFVGVVKYVFEPNTAFTRARKTGADNATGEILLYLDDDVIVKQGSLNQIIKVFSEDNSYGVIAGRVDPKFIEEPPEWALVCQEKFNGWSLFNEDTYNFIKSNYQEVPTAAGPMMAIRRDVYDKVGGFPPDTVGVETNRGDKLFNKLYIGPGDYGLCKLVKKEGYKIIYDENISVYHVIPPLRFDTTFWRSRMIGEGYCRAITERGFFQSNKISLALKRIKYQLLLQNYLSKLSVVLKSKKTNEPYKFTVEEMWLRYYKAYLDMDSVLNKYPDLWKFLWKIADDGVNDENYEYVMSNLPEEYKNLVCDELVYDESEINTLNDLESKLLKKGYFHVSKSIVANKFVLDVLRKGNSVLRYISNIR